MRKENLRSKVVNFLWNYVIRCFPEGLKAKNLWYLLLLDLFPLSDDQKLCEAEETTTFSPQNHSFARKGSKNSSSPVTTSSNLSQFTQKSFQKTFSQEPKSNQPKYTKILIHKKMFAVLRSHQRVNKNYFSKKKNRI